MINQQNPLKVLPIISQKGGKRKKQRGGSIASLCGNYRTPDELKYSPDEYMIVPQMSTNSNINKTSAELAETFAKSKMDSLNDWKTRKGGRRQRTRRGGMNSPKKKSPKKKSPKKKSPKRKKKHTAKKANRMPCSPKTSPKTKRRGKWSPIMCKKTFTGGKRRTRKKRGGFDPPLANRVIRKKLKNHRGALLNLKAVIEKLSSTFVEGINNNQRDIQRIMPAINRHEEAIRLLERLITSLNDKAGEVSRDNVATRLWRMPGGGRTRKKRGGVIPKLTSGEMMQNSMLIYGKK